MSSRRCRHFMHPPPAGAVLVRPSADGASSPPLPPQSLGRPGVPSFSSACRLFVVPPVLLPPSSLFLDTLDYGRMAQQVSIVDKDRFEAMQRSRLFIILMRPLAMLISFVSSSKKYHSNLLEQYGDIKECWTAVGGRPAYRAVAEAPVELDSRELDVG
ncbi:hypothetical protein OsI_32394 [Oryza sativa Indica Group]|uniref:Uncharacterized protein n=1 Tax=Oryza sativa subsp. indica TaxID=39946 RepID=B8BEK4_ORYSI|nr:hypothetical protein OsI_32394 [Oryza sativa Indica Group]